MGKIRIGRGSTAIEMDDTLHQIAVRAIENAAPGLLGELGAAVDEVFNHAHSNWPVKSGQSKADLVSGVGITPAGVEGFVASLSPYGRYIKVKGKAVHTALIFRPGRKVGKTLGARLAPVLASNLLEG